MEKILIIDDNEMMRLFLGNFFSKTHQVTTTDSPLKAKDLMSGNGDFDLIISDYHSNNSPQRRNLLALKQQAEWMSIPLIILSDQDNSQQRIDALDIGANDCLSKPFNPIELSRRVDTMISSSRPAVYRPVA